MENIEEQLESFSIKCNEIENKQFENFGELERAYCDLLNEGGAIRKYLISNPTLCDSNTLLVLTNRTNNASLIADKYKSLLNLLTLTRTLMTKYSEYAQEMLDANNFDEAIRIYEQMFEFTKQLALKQKIIQIYANNLNDLTKATELCEIYERSYPTEVSFYELYAEIADKNNDIPKREYCYKKLQEMKLLNDVKTLVNNDKDYNKAIETLEKLYDITKDYKFKKEVANIYAIYLSDISKAIKYYEGLGNELHTQAFYWWNLSQFHELKKDYFKQIFCMQKAIKIELNKEVEA